MYACIYVLVVTVAVFVGSFEVPACKENLVFILGFVLESRTLLPKLGVSFGVDGQSAVALQAGVLTSKILSRPSAMLCSLRKLCLAGRRPVGRSLRLRVTLQLRR